MCNSHRQGQRTGDLRKHAFSVISKRHCGQTKSYDDYKKLKTSESQILVAIESQKIHDANDVAELRMHVSELDADLLENAQRYQ